MVKAILGPFLALIFRPWSEGIDNVPREGPAIIASNHLSFADHFFGPLPLPRKVTFLAKSEYFTGRGLKGLLKKAFFSGVGGIPLDRAGGRASERAINTGLRVLAQGKLLGIYPEGTRTPDGRLYRGKTGVARLALESGAPVIPCAMLGTFDLMPSRKFIPRLRYRPGPRWTRRPPGYVPERPSVDAWTSRSALCSALSRSLACCASSSTYSWLARAMIAYMISSVTARSTSRSDSSPA